MEVTPEPEAQLSQVANHNGTGAEQSVKDAALRLLEDEARFREGVNRGIAAAGRGEFVEHAEVWANVEEDIAILMRLQWTAPAAQDKGCAQNKPLQNACAVKCFSIRAQQ